MKNLKIKISQQTGFEFTQNYKGIFSEENSRKNLIGTSLKAVIDLIELREKVKFKGINLNLPVDITTECNGQVISTVELATFLRSSLKIGNSPKAKRRFAKKYAAIVDFSIRDLKVTTLEDVLKEIGE